MLPIIDKPLVQYAVEEAIDIGVTEIIFITSHAKKSIEKHFSQNLELEESLLSKGKNDYISLISPQKFRDIKFTFIDQDEQKGLGHAVSLAESSLCEEDDAVAILLPDDLFISKTKSCLQILSDIYDETSHSVIAVNEVPDSQLPNYGVIDPIKISNSIYEINQIIEKPSVKEAPSNLAVCGRYILSSSIFGSLKKIKPGAGGEYQLTDAIKDLLSHEKVLASTYEGSKYDCGSKKGFVEATISVALSNGDLDIDKFNFLKSSIN
jgi:UTP--glucose-1-phosphate uridylyltransferase